MIGELETLRPLSIPMLNVVDAYLSLLDMEDFIVLNTDFSHHFVYESVAELLKFPMADGKMRLEDCAGVIIPLHFE